MSTHTCSPLCEHGDPRDTSIDMQRRKPAPARNYGAKDSGGDAYAMGRALNEEMRIAWLNYKQDRAWLRLHPDQLSAAILHVDSRNAFNALARIRHAGRTSA